MCRLVFSNWAFRSQNPALVQPDEQQNAKCVRGEVSRIKSATKYQLTHVSGSTVIKYRRVPQLTQFDRKTKQQRNDISFGRSRLWRDHTNPAGKHRRPQRIADYIARGTGNPKTVKVNHHTNNDGRSAERKVRYSNLAVLSGIAKHYGSPSTYAAVDFRFGRMSKSP